MHLASLHNLNRLFASAALLLLACADEAITNHAGAGTGSTSTDDGSDTGSPGSDSSGADESTGTGSSGADESTGTGSSGADESTASGSSSTTGSEGTDTTNPVCEPIHLADVAQGVGGFALDGETVEDYSGRRVSAAGDVNGDGLLDVVVGAPGVDPNGISSGRTYVVFGKADTPAASLADVNQGIGGFVLDGEAERDTSGFSVDGAGDVNGDGLDDVVVGAFRADPNGIYNAGRTYVVFGKANTSAVSLADVTQEIGGFAVDGEAEFDISGYSVSGAGDVNGDGLQDVIVGSVYVGGAYSGRTYVVFGKANTDKVALADVAAEIGGFALEGEAKADNPGRSVSGAGDVNADGLADVIVGAYSASPNGVRWSGRTYVVFGKADTDKVLLADVAQGVGGFALDGEAYWDNSGYWVGGAGDVNGDGLADVVVGAPKADPNGDGSGRTYVVFGKADTDKLLLADVAQGIGGFALNGEADGDKSGHSVNGAGDVNGDGLADVIVGASDKFTPYGPHSGRTYVVFGRSDTEKVQLVDVARGIGGFALDPETEDDHAGSSVNGAGDINDDGLADLVVGAFAADPNGVLDSGRTYVVFGGDLSCTGG